MKKSTKIALATLGGIAAVVVISTATSSPKPTGTVTTQVTPAEDHWEFEVTTTGPGISDVTYMKPGMNIAQDTEAKGQHWSAALDADYGYMKPNMNAQNKGNGAITCTIKHNGQVVSTNTSQGSYAIVSCG